MVSNIGVPGFVLFLNIILWGIGLFIFYIVIVTAVKNGINKSVVGQLIEKKYGINANIKSFLDRDLDND